MSFKKMLSVIMVAVICLGLFSGCGEDKKMEDVITTTEIATVSEKTIAMVSLNENNSFYKSLKKAERTLLKNMALLSSIWGLRTMRKAKLSLLLKIFKGL